jgi:hypothetical protein
MLKTDNKGTPDWQIDASALILQTPATHPIPMCLSSYPYKRTNLFPFYAAL